jgi:hypothetical protein
MYSDMLTSWFVTALAGIKGASTAMPITIARMISTTIDTNSLRARSEYFFIRVLPRTVIWTCGKIRGFGLNRGPEQVLVGHG